MSNPRIIPTGIIDRLRKALRDYDRTPTEEVSPQIRGRLAAANTLASYVRDLLAEIDGESRR